MNVKEKNFTQKQIDVIFSEVKILRRAKNRELTKKEIEKLICKVRGIAQS